jgi:hypothetical protein
MSEAVDSSHNADFQILKPRWSNLLLRLGITLKQAMSNKILAFSARDPAGYYDHPREPIGET